VDSTSCANCGTPFGDLKPVWIQAVSSTVPTHQSTPSSTEDDDLIAQLLHNSTLSPQSPELSTSAMADAKAPTTLPLGYRAPQQKQIRFLNGCFIFPDEYGGVLVRQLAGLPSRFIAACIDSFITYGINYAFFFVYVMLLAGKLHDRPSPQEQFLNYVFNGNTSNDNFIPITSATIFMLVLINSVIPACYHTILVAWGGRTLGHRLCGIQVIRSNGKGVGLMAALFRASWGIIYSFMTGFVLGYVLGLIVQRLTYSDIVSFSTSSGSLILLVGIGISAFIVLAVMLSNPSRRGMHDMIADTYVVTNKTLSQLELA
jgi:uncharacterized RDD family membrane protein YckC